MINDKIFVLAGTFEQFQLFRAQLVESMAAEHNWFRISSIIYINGPDTLRGIRDPWGYKVGTWAYRDDIKQIIEQLMIAGSNYREDFIEVKL
jgi:hypothetical protein